MLWVEHEYFQKLILVLSVLVLRSAESFASRRICDNVDRAELDDVVWMLLRSQRVETSMGGHSYRSGLERPSR